MGRNADPFSASLDLIVEFLTEQFQAGKAYSTLGGYRAALSAFHPLIESFKVGQHPTVVQFFKGLYNLRPPRARYSCTWSLDQVLYFIENTWADNKQLSLRLLSWKCLALLALTRPMRASELAAIDLSSIVFSESEASYSLSRPMKNQRDGALRSLSIPRCDRNSICAVSTLEEYINRTRPLRGTSAARKQLFISTIVPHHVVSTTSLSRWLQSAMAAAGIDTSVFKAHSSRSAVTARSRDQGFSLQQILNSAFWRSESTYRRFYQREVLHTS